MDKNYTSINGLLDDFASTLGGELKLMILEQINSNFDKKLADKLDERIMESLQENLKVTFKGKDICESE